MNQQQEQTAFIKKFTDMGMDERFAILQWEANIVKDAAVKMGEERVRLEKEKGIDVLRATLEEVAGKIKAFEEENAKFYEPVKVVKVAGAKCKSAMPDAKKARALARKAKIANGKEGVDFFKCSGCESKFQTKNHHWKKCCASHK